MPENAGATVATLTGAGMEGTLAKPTSFGGVSGGTPLLLLYTVSAVGGFTGCLCAGLSEAAEMLFAEKGLQKC